MITKKEIYEVGDFVYLKHSWEDDVIKVEVIKVFPNTDRYRIKEKGEAYKWMVKWFELYRTPNDYYKEEILRLMKSIKEDQESIEKLNKLTEKDNGK